MYSTITLGKFCHRLVVWPDLCDLYRFHHVQIASKRQSYLGQTEKSVLSAHMSTVSNNRNTLVLLFCVVCVYELSVSLLQCVSLSSPDDVGFCGRIMSN